MTTLKLWSEGKEMTESGVEIGGIQVTWAEIDLATDRASAIDIRMTSDLCDDFEVDHKDYADLPYWLDMVAAEPLLRQDQDLCHGRLLRLLAGPSPQLRRLWLRDQSIPGQDTCSPFLDADL